MFGRHLFGHIGWVGSKGDDLDSPARPTPFSTISLNHFDGANLGAIPPDEVAGLTWTGTGTLRTAEKKFGTASLRGSAHVATISFDVTADWTFEFFCFFDVVGFVTIAIRSDGLDNACQIQAGAGAVPGDINVIYTDAGSSFLTQFVPGVVDASTWHHIAVVRSFTDYSLYFDGSRVAVDTTATNIRLEDTVNTVGFGTYLDEFRLSQGARYTGATYTVPAAPFIVD